MPLLNLDVLVHISHFCQLRDRYHWSICHRRFEITEDDWVPIVKSYLLTSVTDLRKICLRQYCSSLTISQRSGCLWSEQMNEPLTVWSPWTLHKLCTISHPKAFFRFREHRFVSFVQKMVQTFGLKSSVVRRLNHVECVYATVWSIKQLQIPIHVRYRQKRMKRRCLVPILQSLSWKKLRCLLEFRVVAQKLRLRVKHLEFSTL